MMMINMHPDALVVLIKLFILTVLIHKAWGWLKGRLETMKKSPKEGAVTVRVAVRHCACWGWGG